MRTRRWTALAGTTAVALTLGACSTGGDEPAEDSTQTQEQTPSIEVPEVSNGNTIDFKLNPHGLDQGTNVRIGVYGGGFGDDQPTCETEIESTEITVADGQSRGSVAVSEPGRYQVVMSTDGFASPCDDPNATTTVKTEPDMFLDGDLKSDSPSTLGASQGESFDVAVVLDGEVPKGTELPVKLTAYGPYSTDPELRADQCNDTKVAAEQEIVWKGEDRNRADNRYTSASMTLDGTKGLYLIKATTDGSESVSATETDCTNFQSALKVSTKDGAKQSQNGDEGGKGDSSEEGEGTNALTGNRDAEEDK